VMEKGANGDPADVAVETLDPGSTEEQIDSSAAVVVSATPRRVVLDGPPTIDARGRVTRHPRVLAGIDGVYAAGVSAHGQSLLSGPGVWTTLIPGASQDYQSDTIPAQAPARGGALLSRQPLEEFADDIWLSVRQPVGSGDNFRLLAVESPARPQSEGPVRGLVGVITLPSGARVLAAGEQRTGDGWIQVDAGRVLPAEPTGSVEAGRELSIAWRRPTTRTDPGWTAAMGPVGTARVQWIHRDGSVTSAAAVNTISAAEHDDVTSVRFLDAAGAVIGTAKVLEPVDADLAILPEVGPPASPTASPSASPVPK
jgi:hypothetical protein